MFCKTNGDGICFCGAHCSCIECDRNVNGEKMNDLLSRYGNDARYNIMNFSDRCKRYNYVFPAKAEDIGVGDLFYTKSNALLRAIEVGDDYVDGIVIHRNKHYTYGEVVKCKKSGDIDFSKVRRAYV